MSVIMQSRGNPPVANWIFAKFLHARRGLARRFAANMSGPCPCSMGIHSMVDQLYRTNVGIGLARRLAM
jgi:hypothetical protein